MSRLRTAVIGAGHLGRIHARLLTTLPDVELVAAADPSPQAQKLLLEQIDVPVVSDYRKLLDDIDAAVVATPTRFHFDVASDCLRNGIDLLIEKPLTDSVTDARALVELAQECGRVVQVGHVERFNASIRRAQQLVGTPKFVLAERMSGYTYRSTDIGVVHDLMIHDIDLMHSFFGEMPCEVRASGISVFGGHEDLAQARLAFPNGGIANLTASRCSFEPQRRLQIFGTDGYAQIDLAQHRVRAIRIPSWIRDREFDFQATTPEQQAFIREQLFDRILPIQEEEVEPVNAILAEQQDWIDAIASGAAPTIPVAAGCEAVEVADQVLQAISKHVWEPSANGSAGPLAIPVRPPSQRDYPPLELEVDAPRRKEVA